MEKEHGYLSVKLEDSSADTVFNMLVRCGVNNPLPTHEMHVTLMYDKSNPTTDPECDPKRSFSARVCGFGILGNAIVVHLESDDLQKRHCELKEKGFVHSYPDYTCHMTLKYIPEIGPTGSEQELMKLTQIYNGGYFDNVPLYFHKESSKPLEDGDGMVTKLALAK